MQLRLDAADRLVELVEDRRGPVPADEAARKVLKLGNAVPTGLARTLLAEAVAADARLRYGHEQTAAVMRCVTTHAGRELEHGYGEEGVELRFRVPLARCDSLERCLRDSTRGAVTLERLGETVIRSA